MFLHQSQLRFDGGNAHFNIMSVNKESIQKVTGRCKCLILEDLYNYHQANGLYIDMCSHLLHPNRLHCSHKVKYDIYQHLKLN